MPNSCCISCLLMTCLSPLLAEQCVAHPETAELRDLISFPRLFTVSKCIRW